MPADPVAADQAKLAGIAVPGFSRIQGAVDVEGNGDSGGGRGNDHRERGCREQHAPRSQQGGESREKSSETHHGWSMGLGVCWVLLCCCVAWRGVAWRLSPRENGRRQRHRIHRSRRSCSPCRGCRGCRAELRTSTLEVSACSVPSPTMPRCWHRMQYGVDRTPATRTEMPFANNRGGSAPDNRRLDTRRGPRGKPLESELGGIPPHQVARNSVPLRCVASWWFFSRSPAWKQSEPVSLYRGETKRGFCSTEKPEKAFGNRHEMRLKTLPVCTIAKV